MVKQWYASKTIWAGVVALLSGLAGLAGYTVSPADQVTLVELLVALGSSIGGIGAIYGRTKARDGVSGGKSAGASAGILALLAALGVGFAPGAEAQEPDLGYIEWQTPTHRENGEPLAPEEIGGYEIRYTVEGELYSTIIQDRDATGYDVSGLEPAPSGATTFEIAVYDTNGLYSEFVGIEADVSQSAPAGLNPGYTPPAGTDPTEACVQDDRCRVDMLSARYGQ